MWEEVTGPDGIVRQMQWTSRVEGSNGIPNGNAMTLSLYLGRGAVSRGRTTIGKGLNMVVSALPYGDANDLAAVAVAIDHMVSALKNIPNITWNLPPPGTSGAQYLASVSSLLLCVVYDMLMSRSHLPTPTLVPGAPTTGSGPANLAMTVGS